MHEASIAEGLLNLAADSVQQYNAAHPEKPAGKVTSLTLGIGLLSCIEVETFRGCFSLLAEGTSADGAELDIKLQPLQCHCESCGTDFELRKRHFHCPHCDSDQLSFSGGHEIVLLSLEVEKKD